MKLIVGLGNPGKKYETTRHNFGFLVLEELAERYHVIFKDDTKFKGTWAQVNDSHHDKIFLLKPTTFMNLSGESAIALMQFYKIHPQDILVVHDEIDLSFGRFKFSRGGSAAGNNGIRSLIQHLGTQKFSRLRLGVGRPKHPGQDVADYVLQKFAKDEWQKVPDLLHKACDAIEFYLKTDLETAMGEFNQKAIFS